MDTALVEYQDTIPALSIEAFTATPTGLIVTDGDVPFEVWEAYGKALQRVEGAIHWVIGDWLNYGEWAYGEKYSQALNDTDYKYSTLRDDLWVSRQIELSRRRDNLSWSYHREVASLEPDEQNFFLDAADREGWSRSQLRNEIRAYKKEKQLEAQTPPDVRIDDAIILGDCTAVTWPGRIDLIIADPPFGLTVGDSAGVRDGKGDWDEKDYADLHAFNFEWLWRAVDALKQEGSIFVFGTVHNIFSVGHILKELDCYIVRDIVWNKPFVQRQVNLYSLVPSHELIVWARKGGRHTCNLNEVTRDVWKIQPASKFGHPTEKPEELIRRIIEMASNPGELVADPFLGSGTTTAVAKQLKRAYWGVELDERWWKIATERTRNS